MESGNRSACAHPRPRSAEELYQRHGTRFKSAAGPTPEGRAELERLERARSAPMRKRKQKRKPKPKPKRQKWGSLDAGSESDGEEWTEDMEPGVVWNLTRPRPRSRKSTPTPTRISDSMFSESDGETPPPPNSPYPGDSSPPPKPKQRRSRRKSRKVSGQLTAEMQMIAKAEAAAATTPPDTGRQEEVKWLNVNRWVFNAMRRMAGDKPDPAAAVLYQAKMDDVDDAWMTSFGRVLGTLRQGTAPDSSLVALADTLELQGEQRLTMMCAFGSEWDEEIDSHEREEVSQLAAVLANCP